jgi:hypothetical protein
MPCDFARQALLEFGWNAATRQRAAQVLAHLETCSDCRQAVDDFDRLRESLETSDESEPIGGWASFEARLSDAVKPQRSLRLRWLAVAAAVLISASAFELGRWMEKPVTSPFALVTTAAQPVTAPHFDPHEITQAVNAFDQVSKVFDGRASWMLVSRESSDVGVAPDAVDLGRKVLLLRLTVTRSGQPASDADLLVIPGQTANLTVPIRGGQSLKYRIGTSADEPTRLAVWMEVSTPHGGQAVGALSTTLNMDPGQKVTAGQLSTTAGEYELKIAFSRATLPEGKR